MLVLSYLYDIYLSEKMISIKILFIHFACFSKYSLRGIYIFIVNKLMYIVIYSMTEEINNEHINLKIILFDQVQNSSLIFIL